MALGLSRSRLDGFRVSEVLMIVSRWSRQRRRSRSGRGGNPFAVWGALQGYVLSCIVALFLAGDQPLDESKGTGVFLAGRSRVGKGRPAGSIRASGFPFPL